MEKIGTLLIMGVTIGGIYGVIALGMIVVYKATGILNLVHGMVMVLLGYLAWVLMVSWGAPVWISIVVIIALGGVLAYVIQWVAIRPLIGQPVLATVMMTFALGFVITAMITIQWSGVHFALPSYIPKGMWHLGEISVLKEQAIAFAVTLLLFATVGLVFRYTKLGLGMRAVADNVVLTESAGVNVRHIFGLSWLVGGVIAAVAGLILASLYDVSVDWGHFALSKALPIMLLGGLESLPGALIGGIIVGLAEVFGVTYIDPLVGGGVRDIVPFVLMLLVLLFRPWGLFGWERIERV